MTLDALREALPAYARDLRLNLGSVLTAGGAPGLTERQACAVALASAIACGHAPLAQAIESAAAAQLSDADRSAARAAVVSALRDASAVATNAPARCCSESVGSTASDDRLSFTSLA